MPNDIEQRWEDQTMYSHLITILMMLGGSVQAASEKTAGSTIEKIRIENLIQQLNGDSFADREAAAHELDRLGQTALPYLSKVLQGKPSLELRRRVESLINKIERCDPAY